MSTITFPSPSGAPDYVPVSTAPVTVSRSLWDDASSYASGAVSDAREAATQQASGYADQAREYASGAVDQATAAAGGYADQARQDAAGAIDQAQAAATGAIGEARAALPGAADKQFEELYDRLKRELMIEQEQLGQLFHDP